MNTNEFVSVVKTAGEIGGIIWLILMFWKVILTAGLLEAAPAKETAPIIKLFTWLSFILAVFGISAKIYSDRMQVDLETPQARLSLNTSTETVLPPITFDQRTTIVTPSTVDPQLLDRVSSQAASLSESRGSLQKAQETLKDQDKTLAVWQLAYLEQNNASAVNMLKDLAQLRNYTVLRSAFENRWSQIIPNEQDRINLLDHVLIKLNFIQQTNNVLTVSDRGMYALSARGEIPAVLSDRSDLPSWCPKASTSIEKTICGNKQLAENEVALLGQLATARQFPGSTQIDSDQVIWRKQVRDQCTTIECLQTAYVGRINFLASIINDRGAGR